jgi:hypothetical protein
MYYTYTIGVRVAQPEKFFGVSRVCLGFEYVFDAVCATDAQAKSHAAYEDVHIVFRCKETSAGERQYGIGDGVWGYSLTWDL